MSPLSRTLAGVGVELRLVRARFNHKHNWIVASLIAAGDCRLLSGDEKGAELAYREARKRGLYRNQRPDRTLICLYAKQERWSEAYSLLKQEFDLGESIRDYSGFKYTDKKFALIALRICQKVHDKQAENNLRAAIQDLDRPRKDTFGDVRYGLLFAGQQGLRQGARML
jgi:hypothetical protein